MLIDYAFASFERHFSDYIIMEYGASTHYGTRVRNYLNRKRPNNWFGTGGSVHWLARSPNLTPFNFFLWRYFNAHIYATPVRFVEDFEEIITREVRKIPLDMSKNLRENSEFRLDFLECVNGRDIQQTM